MTAQTREQKIVAAIAQKEGLRWHELESRAAALPAMVLRHGVLPVKLFLESKNDADKQLWGLVEESIRAVLPSVALDAKGLAAMVFETYLLVNEVAAEAAALVARWVKVRCVETGPRVEPLGTAREAKGAS